MIFARDPVQLGIRYAYYWNMLSLAKLKQFLDEVVVEFFLNEYFVNFFAGMDGFHHCSGSKNKIFVEGSFID